MKIEIADPKTAAALSRIVVILMARDLIDEGADLSRDHHVALVLLGRKWPPSLVAVLMDDAVAEVRRAEAPVRLQSFFALADAYDGAIGRA